MLISTILHFFEFIQFVQFFTMSENVGSEGIYELNDLLIEVNEVACLSITNERKVKKATDIVSRADAILRDVCKDENCVEALSVDLHVVHSAASIIGNEIGNHKSKIKNYNPVEFATSIKNCLGSSKNKWLDFFDISMLGHGVAPANFGMFQTFNPDERPPPKERQKRQKNIQNAQEILTCPESIQKSEQMEETSAVLKKIQKIIQRAYQENDHKPLNYFEVVVDPTDFGQTVDNIFQVSFLIRDYALAMFYKDKHLWIQPMTRAESDNHKESQPAQQHIISITMDQWERLIKKYDIKRPLIDIKDRYLGDTKKAAN